MLGVDPAGRATRNGRRSDHRQPGARRRRKIRLPPRSSFNNFYHRFHILSEPDAERQQFLLYLVHLVNQTLTAALELMGIEVPERM